VRGRRRAALSLVGLLLLPSCFTMTLWGFDHEREQDRYTGETSSSFSYDQETEWSWELLGMRLLGTPFALALDCLTAPVQAYFLVDEDEDDGRDHGYHVDQRR